MDEKKKESAPREIIPGGGPPTKAGLGTKAAGSKQKPAQTQAKD